MKRFLVAFTAVLIFTFAASAQNNKGWYEADSLVYIPTAALDSSLVGKDVFGMISSEIHQSAQIKSGLASRIEKNASRKISGYRVRIFFDNKQSSRGDSEAALNRFRNMFPGVAAYRSFANPFFKVTVGDFRTRSEATSLLQQVKGVFPSAILIKENINFPVVNTSNSYVVDTVRVRRQTSAR